MVSVKKKNTAGVDTIPKRGWRCGGVSPEYTARKTLVDS